MKENSKTAKELVIIFAALAAIGVVAFIDDLTGQNLDLAPFYLIISGFCVWFTGRRGGIAVSLIAFFAWEVEGLKYGIPGDERFFFTWNMAARSVLFIMVITLVHILKESYARERGLAMTDSLTGAANRRNFFAFLTTEISRARRQGTPVTLAYIDIDVFKQINDTYGHHEGDRVLKETTTALAAHIRQTDLLARLGGDEFAIVLPGCDANQAGAFVENARSALGGIVTPGGQVTYSFGVLTAMRAPENPEELVIAADKFMYEVKKSGRNGTKFGEFSGESPASE
jgi:diguanylate cyclase (GGDEF)-like protein